MDDRSIRLLPKAARLSRNIFLLFLIASVTLSLIELSRMPWLLPTIPWLLIVWKLTFLCSWIPPGIFVVLGKPWFAHVWFRGSSVVTPWEQLPEEKKYNLYFRAILSTTFALIGLFYSVFR